MTRWPALLCLLVASTARAGDVAADAVAALSARHAPPPCDALAPEVTDRAELFVRIANEVSMPPWVPLRAARCASLLPEAQSAVSAWLRDPARPGLALVVAQTLDALPTDRAITVASEALAGPHAARLTPTLARSTHADVRARVVPR